METEAFFFFLQLNANYFIQYKRERVSPFIMQQTDATNANTTKNKRPTSFYYLNK